MIVRLSHIWNLQNITDEQLQPSKVTNIKAGRKRKAA